MIRDESSGALLGRSLGAGIGQGLEGLIQNKLQEIQQSKFSSLLQQNGYDEPTSQLLTQIQQQNPKQFAEILKILGPSQMPQAEGQQTAPQQGGLRNSIASSQVNQGIKTKHYDQLVDQRQNLEDIVTTSKRMLESLDKGISTGLVASAKGKFAPTWLDENSELFDKESSHLVNLAGKELKGPASKYRISLLEREKPSLSHSPKVNRQILERFIQKAESNLNDMTSRYPELSSFGVQQLDPVAQKINQQHDASQYPDGTEVEFEGKRFVVQNGQFVLAGGV